MMRIVLGSQKGGTGKSTLALLLAKYAFNSSDKLVIIDADPQATFYNINTQKRLNFECVKLYGDISTQIKHYKSNSLIIDCAGKDSVEFRSSLLIADIVIVPFAPTQIDLNTVHLVNNVIQEAQQYNKKLVALAIMNLASTHYLNRTVTGAKEFISSYSIFKMLDSVLKNRLCYQTMFDTQLKLTNPRAKAEIRSLVRELKLIH